MSRVALVDRGALAVRKDRRVCAMDGCDRLALYDGYCLKCFEDRIGIAAYMASREVKRKQGARSKGAGLSGWAYAAAAIAAEWYFLWETRDFWWGCLQLWFGKK